MRKRRTAVRLLSFCAAALLVMGGFTVRVMGEAQEDRRQLEAGWRRSFAALTSDAAQIRSALT